MYNSKYQCHMLRIPRTNLLLLAAKQEPYKNLSLNEKYWRIFREKFRRKHQQAEKEETHTHTQEG